MLLDTEWRLEDYWRVLRLHKILIGSSAVLFAVVAFLYVAQKPNLYQATARLVIEAQTPQVVQFREVTPYTAGSWMQGFLQTEYRIITSRPIMEKIVEDLNLVGFPPFSRSEDPAATLQGMIDVSLVRGTKLVDITATNRKPELAARIANAVAETYARVNLERKQEATTGGAEWLKDEVAKMEEKLRTSQQGLQTFKDQYRSVDFSEEQQNTLLQRLRELTSAVTEAKKQRIEAETRYRAKHPVLLELQAKERELQEALKEQEDKVAELNRLSVQYNTLLRELKTNESIHSALSTRLKELSVQEGIQANNVQIVSEAQVPRHPFSPRRGRAVTLALFFGIFFGSAASLLLESFSRNIRSRREFEQILEIPFLGYVPLIELTKEHRGSESLVLLAEPKSSAAESARAIRTTLEFLLPAGQPYVILITSALPEEGKSLLSLNLAIALQELGRKVVLVDADMRRPSVHRLLTLSLEPGLSGYLQGEVGIEELVQSAATARELPVIAAGLTPSQPTDLLAAAKMRELLEFLKKDYQYVLLDTPPVLAVADATAMASLADGVLYVVRGGRTHRDVAVAGKARLVDVGAKIIGGVLNGVRAEASRDYHYKYYYAGGTKQRRRPKKEMPPVSPEPPFSSAEESS